MKRLINVRNSIVATLMTMCCLPMTVFAAGDTWDGADVNEVTSPILKMKTLLLEVLSAVGVIVVIVGISKILGGTKNGNDEKTDQGIKTLVIGFLMASIGGLLAYLGL